MLPEARESDCLVRGVALPFPSFCADDVVCVVSEEGSLTGRVGDFGLGLTKPVPEGGTSTGAGLDTAVFGPVAFLWFVDEVVFLAGSLPL